MKGLSTEQNVHKSMNIVHYLATLAGIFAFIPSLFSTLVGFVSISAMNIYYEL